MRGDRVAVLGRGIAVVEHADETEVAGAAGEQNHVEDAAQGHCLEPAEHAVGGEGLSSDRAPSDIRDLKSLTSCLPTNRPELRPSLTQPGLQTNMVPLWWVRSHSLGRPSRTTASLKNWAAVAWELSSKPKTCPLAGLWP